jgi:hypothetical protein
MKHRSQILRKFRRPALWGLAVPGVALLAALWISALADLVPSRRFTYRDGTYDHFFGWENADLLEMYPDGRVQRKTVTPIPVQIATNEWADLYIVYMFGLGRIHGIDGEAYIMDRTGKRLWARPFDGMLEDGFSHSDCWWLWLADVDGDGRAEAITIIDENEESESWTGERCLKTVAQHTWVERLDGKQTSVDVRSLPRWRRQRFGLKDVSAPADVPDWEDDTDSENPEEQELAFGHDCNAAVILRYYNECRKDELARRKRLCRCAAPYPADIQLLVDEAYDAAKRYAERYTLRCNRRGGSGVPIGIMEVQEKICDLTVSLIERICSRRLEPPPQAPGYTVWQVEDVPRTKPGLFPPYSDTDHVEAAFTRLFARLLPEVPAPNVQRHVEAVLRPKDKPCDMVLRIEFQPSDWMLHCAYPRDTAQNWTAPEHARKLLETHEREIRRLETLARRGDRQSLERVLELLLFNPPNFFTADPARAQDIYRSVKAAHPNLRLEGETKIELILYLCTSTPFDWGDRTVYGDVEEVDLDLWGDGEPGYLLSLAWHYAHDPAFRWDVFQRILARSGGGREALYANMRHAYLYVQECGTWVHNDASKLFIAGTAGIAFDTPRELRRYLAYHERKRLAFSEIRDVYLCGRQFIALQNASETCFLGPDAKLRRTVHENALRQDMAIDLILLDENMQVPVPSDEERTWNEYRCLCDEVTALIASGGQSEKLPNLAAFTATQEAWAEYCRAFVNAVKPWDRHPVTHDAWLAWLLEKRILQLRRLKHGGAAPNATIRNDFIRQ